MTMSSTAAAPSILSRWGRAGAAYDLVVSAVFASPWSASLVFDLLRAVHTGLGLPGSPLPVPGTTTLLFVSLFGTVVVIWSVARLYRPTRLLISIDTIGRAVFSLWFVWGLWQGLSWVTVPFLALELAWGVAQLRAVMVGRDSR